MLGVIRPETREMKSCTTNQLYLLFISYDRTT